MTKEQKETAIRLKELPPDFLDKFWPIFWGFMPVVFCAVGSLVLLLFSIMKQQKLPVIFLPFFIFFFLQLFLCVFFKITDRKLLYFPTGFTNVVNEDLAVSAAKLLGWQTQKNENYIAINKAFVFGGNMYLIKVLTNDEGIYYNLRTTGTAKGRIMHTFGLETLRSRQFLRALKLLVKKYN